MTYSEILRYLYTQLPMFHRVGAAAYKADLSTTQELGKLLGNPELSYRTIHIAGTNGKGSTSHFLASILQEAGYKTGLFTSPHLKDFRERIRVNGKMIPRRQVSLFVSEHLSDFDALKPSFFEWTFALASDYFRLENVDVAVMETGMGGRLDSTNIISPVLTVITNIGMDHMQFLGNTPEAIATEKAGIIKKGIPLVVGETQDTTADVFKRTAAGADAPVAFADQRYKVVSSALTRHASPLLRAEITRNGEAFGIFWSPLSSRYQLKNLVTVLQAVEVLRQSGFRISDAHLHNGIRRVIRNTGFQGRWQILSKQPKTIVDISHNVDGIAQLMLQLESTSYRKLHFVLGVVSDKDVSAMLKLLPRQARYYFCKADIPRGLDANLLKSQAEAAGLHGESYPSVKLALQAARAACEEQDLVVVSGSAFVVAEVL